MRASLWLPWIGAAIAIVLTLPAYGGIWMMWAYSVENTANGHPAGIGPWPAELLLATIGAVIGSRAFTSWRREAITRPTIIRQVLGAFVGCILAFFGYLGCHFVGLKLPGAIGHLFWIRDTGAIVVAVFWCYAGYRAA